MALSVLLPSKGELAAKLISFLHFANIYPWHQTSQKNQKK